MGLMMQIHRASLQMMYNLHRMSFDSMVQAQYAANYASSQNSFDYNAGKGFFDDAGNFYDRDSMRELLNFYFQDGLDLNDDDHWDEVTITTKSNNNKQQKKSAAAASTNYDDDYYSYAYDAEADDGGFEAKGKYYKKQAALSERKVAGMNDEPFLAS